MTIDDLATISHSQFEGLRREMATREELKATETVLLRALEGLGVQIAGYASRWDIEFDRLAGQVQELRDRSPSTKQSRDSPAS
jgi:hypothetical protein